jgi:hypothetical protein
VARNRYFTRCGLSSPFLRFRQPQEGEVNERSEACGPTVRSCQWVPSHREVRLALVVVSS